MIRSIRDRNIWVIYVAILLLGVAYGTSIAVLAIHLDAHGVSEIATGALATAFALGIMIFSLPAGSIIKRFGAKRVFVGALLGYAVCVASFPYLTTLPALAAARFVDGACSVMIWVAAETALLSRSDRNNKGFVMSLYAICLAIGYVVGPLVARIVVGKGGTSSAFLIAGVLACIAVTVIVGKLDAHDPGSSTIEVAATGEVVDERESAAKVVFWRTKMPCFATFSYGYFQTSVVLFLPLYLIKQKDIPADRTILVTAFFAAGMLVMSSWAGRLGDRYGHLLVMRILGAVGGLMVASFVALSSFSLMCVAVFVAGATLASISPVSLALQGIVTPRPDLERANAFYNAAYAVGMLIGPPISSLLFTRFGGAAMLFHLAALWAAFVTLTMIFSGDDPRKSTRSAALPSQGAGAMVR